MKIRFLFLITFLFCIMACPTFASSKSDFVYLYKTVWDRDNLSYKLFKTTEDTFYDNTNDMNLRAIGFQIAFNRNNIVEKLQEEIFKSFDAQYAELLINMKNRLPKNHVEIRNEAEKNFVKDIWTSLKPKLLNPFYPIIWLIVGAVLLFGQRFFAVKIREVLRVSRSTAVFTKIMFFIAGLSILSFGIYQASQVAAMTRSMTRKLMYESTRDFYAFELPNLYKEAIN